MPMQKSNHASNAEATSRHQAQVDLGFLVIIHDTTIVISEILKKPSQEGMQGFYPSCEPSS
jgi:hypothetical protein